MNVAPPALIVFVVLLPGFIARAQIKLAERERLDYSPFGSVVVEGVVWSVVLHAAWLTACAMSGRFLDFQTLLGMLSSIPALQNRAMTAAHAQAGPIALYFGSQLFAAALVTPQLRRLIIHYRLDRRDSRLAWLLRFRRAPWYYLLSGADFSEEQAPDLISIAVVVEVAGSAVLYVGSLAGYYFDAEGRLERLVLDAAQWRS